MLNIKLLFYIARKTTFLFYFSLSHEKATLLNQRIINLYLCDFQSSFGVYHLQIRRFYLEKLILAEHCFNKSMNFHMENILLTYFFLLLVIKSSPSIAISKVIIHLERNVFVRNNIKKNTSSVNSEKVKR